MVDIEVNEIEKAIIRVVKVEGGEAREIEGRICIVPESVAKGEKLEAEGEKIKLVVEKDLIMNNKRGVVKLEIELEENEKSYPVRTVKFAGFSLEGRFKILSFKTEVKME